MRTIRYYVVNKNTRKAVYAESRKDRAEAFLTGLVDKENYIICYKWLSL